MAVQIPDQVRGGQLEGIANLLHRKPAENADQSYRGCGAEKNRNLVIPQIGIARLMN